MKNNTYEIRSKVWLYQGDSPWHFVTIEKKDAEMIKQNYVWPRRGFGSIPVNATIKKTTWKTSLFPDKNNTFVLPLKKDIREKEDIHIGDSISFTIEIL